LLSTWHNNQQVDGGHYEAEADKLPLKILWNILLWKKYPNFDSKLHQDHTLYLNISVNEFTLVLYFSFQIITCIFLMYHLHLFTSILSWQPLSPWKWYVIRRIQCLVEVSSNPWWCEGRMKTFCSHYWNLVFVTFIYYMFLINTTPSGIGTHFNQTLYPPDHIPLSRRKWLAWKTRCKQV
jgi:hypothetical protein